MTHEKHFNHVLVTALFTDNEPQRTSELYRNHDYPIYEHKLQAYPRMPLFPSMVVREKSEGDTTKRDGITKYIKALSEKLEPFTVQLGDEVVIGGSVGDSRRVREVAPSEGVLRLRYEIGYIARRLSVVYDARAMHGLDTMAYVQHDTTDAILPGVQEMEVTAISVITTHSDDKNAPTKVITRCDYPLGRQPDATELSNELFIEDLSHYLMGDGTSDGLAEYSEHTIPGKSRGRHCAPDREGRVYRLPRHRRPV
ncbi:hypothetical protein HG433_003965 [Candidatus Saccharibacteria bacterium]|jgi:hypothetical protein|nr:hypothetical protein [Candidatus Saccharibacteria bacterium]